MGRMARAWSASRVLVMEGIEIVKRNRLCEWIHSRVRVCVCLSNKLGKGKHVEKPSRLGLQVLSPKKKRVRNACDTIWWWYPIELRINGLRVAQIPSKRPNQFFYTNQKCCKGSEFHGCLGLQTSKNQRDRSPDATLFLVVNVGKYTIHGSYGFCYRAERLPRICWKS